MVARKCFLWAICSHLVAHALHSECMHDRGMWVATSDVQQLLHHWDLSVALRFLTNVYSFIFRFANSVAAQKRANTIS